MAREWKTCSYKSPNSNVESVLLSLQPAKRDVPVSTTVSGLTVITLNFWFYFFKNLYVNVKPGQEKKIKKKKKRGSKQLSAEINNSSLYI